MYVCTSTSAQPSFGWLFPIQGGHTERRQRERALRVIMLCISIVGDRRVALLCVCVVSLVSFHAPRESLHALPANVLASYFVILDIQNPAIGFGGASQIERLRARTLVAVF